MLIKTWAPNAEILSHNLIDPGVQEEWRYGPLGKGPQSPVPFLGELPMTCALIILPNDPLNRMPPAELELGTP